MDDIWTRVLIYREMVRYLWQYNRSYMDFTSTGIVASFYVE